MASNVEHWVPTEQPLDNGSHASEALADVVVAAGGLALIVTALMVLIGPRFGGPAATVKLWIALGPLLAVPMAILLAVLLTPGGVLDDGAAGWRSRVTCGLGACIVFALALLLLNLPVLLPARP